MTERTPQVEDGFTRIANDLIEALVGARLNGRELAVALAIVRKTYGFQKKSDRISASQIADLTGIPAKKIGSVLTSLEAKHVLIVKRRGQGKMPTVGIDKRTSKWLMRSSASPHTGVSEHPPTRGEVAKQHTPTRGEQHPPYRGEQPPPTRGDTKERKKERQGSSSSGSDRVVPMLSAEELDRMVDRFPGGQTYTHDEVRAWVVATWPDLLAYRIPKTGKPYARPQAALQNWWKRTRRDDVDAAVRAAVARSAAAKLSAPVPEIDEAKFSAFVDGMKSVGF